MCVGAPPGGSQGSDLSTFSSGQKIRVLFSFSPPFHNPPLGHSQRLHPQSPPYRHTPACLGSFGGLWPPSDSVTLSRIGTMSLCWP